MPDQRIIGWAIENPQVWAAIESFADKHGRDFELAFASSAEGFPDAHPGIDPHALLVRRKSDGEPLAVILPDGETIDLTEDT